MNQYEMKKLAYQSNLRNRALQVLLYLIDRANKEQTSMPFLFNGAPPERDRGSKAGWF